MKNIQRIHRLLYAAGLGPIVGKIILLLTTTGRRSGKTRVTPLQYEEIEGKYYIGSARGTKADWYCNIKSDPRVKVRVKSRLFRGLADATNDPVRIADFLEIRLRKHPFMVGILLQKIYKLPRQPSRDQLLKLAESEALVIITPLEDLR